MTVLPAVHVIKTAILNFDEFAISKEGIEVGLYTQSTCAELRGFLGDGVTLMSLVWSRRSSP